MKMKFQADFYILCLFALTAFDFPHGKSYMEELMQDGPETVEELFNGKQSLYSLDQNG